METAKTKPFAFGLRKGESRPGHSGKAVQRFVIRAMSAAKGVTLKSEGAKIRLVEPAKGSGLCRANDTVVLYAPL
jgi:hypothetical protein